MKGVSLLVLLGTWATLGRSQFLNHRPFPTYSLEKMPDTEFSCRDKILGGYYADAEAQCQMFHICVKVAGVGVQDFRFLCPNGTAFDQDHQICAEWEDVDCDATTLYYSSDNFDLYRIGSGFESKAVKYGEDEETFSLQKAETGDTRLNREHQAQRVNQHQQQEAQYRNNRPHRVNNNNQNNNERDIFKGSSSSNFFNNRNGGKENDDDYDDQGNVNQHRDDVQKKKVVRKQHRRPVEQQNSNNNKRPQNNEQNNDYNRRPLNNNQNEEHNRRPPQLGENRRPAVQQQTQQQKLFESNLTPTTLRPNKHHTGGFNGNFAGSTYSAPTTTSRPSSTTIDADQYTTAINNYKARTNVQKQQPFNNERQYNNADNFRHNPSTPSGFSISTPAPFRQTQYNSAPVKQTTKYDDGQYRPTTEGLPLGQTENYPANFPKVTQKTYYPSTSVKKATEYATQPTTTKYTQHYNTQSATKQFSQTYSQPSVKPNTQNYNQQITKQFTQNYNTPIQAKPYTQTPVQTKQYSVQTKQYSQNPVPTKQQYPPNQFTIQKSSTPAPANNNRNNQQYYNAQYDIQKSKPKQSDVFNANYNKKPTTQYSPSSTQYSPPSTQANKQTNLPSTFAPRTNSAYSQIAQQTTQYKANPLNSTTRPSPFTQYTPTVPKIVTTTPISRLNRFDETQYDDGSYNEKYDRYDQREDESLRTAHSQNIASSQNELAKTTKHYNVPPSTPKPYHESPRPFSVSYNTPKSAPQKPLPVNKPPPKKDTSYDYAYYDVGSEPEYEIDTEIKKSTAKN